MVREALRHAEPARVDGTTVTLSVTESEVHLEGLERSRDLIAETIGAVCNVAAVHLVYQSAGEAADRAEPAGAPPAAAPTRLNQETDKSARLQHYRQKDPALDAMADSLDLEVMD